MHARIKASLGSVPYGDFLVYLMGPYTTFDVVDLVPDGVDPDDVSLPAASAGDEALDEMMGTLRSIQGSLRADPGVNAFLAVDPDIPLEDLDERGRERVMFAHEDTVSSAMIRSISQRWDARVVSYDDEAELRDEIRQFVADLMNRELYGDLPRKTSEGD